MQNESLVIEGITENGDRFRPSDWAERLASLAARYDKSRRLRFSTSLRPIREQEFKALKVDRSLAESAPCVWAQVMRFAEKNRLRIRGEGADLSNLNC